MSTICQIRRFREMDRLEVALSQLPRFLKIINPVLKDLATRDLCIIS